MILVTGATGYLGRRVVRRLCERHEQVRCLVRATSDTSELEHLEVEIHVGDLEDRPSACPAFRDADAVIHLAHIRYAPVVLESASPGVSRIVLLSSLRALSRVPSSSVTDVRTGEAAARASRLPWILLRPSMIYGPGDDRNISRLADFLRRHRIFPVLCDGRTLQQPVFVEDVVQAVLAAAAGQGHTGQVYGLAGPRPLSYDELVDLVAQSTGRTPVKVHVPAWAATALMRMAGLLGIRLPVDGEQVRRLQEDKTCSIQAARSELDFQPIDFTEGLARICGDEGMVP